MCLLFRLKSDLNCSKTIQFSLDYVGILYKCVTVIKVINRPINLVINVKEIFLRSVLIGIHCDSI